jgi:hypothetical protein
MDEDPDISALRIRDLLKEIRYPEISVYRAEQKEIRDSYPLPSGISVITPEDFEGGVLKVTFEIKSSGDFLKKKEELSSDSFRDFIDKLLNIMV